MKKILSISFLVFILSSNLYAYKDMSEIANRANDLNMNIENYTFAMAISGIFAGSIFGLFLWKVK